MDTGAGKTAVQDLERATERLAHASATSRIATVRRALEVGLDVTAGVDTGEDLRLALLLVRRADGIVDLLEALDDLEPTLGPRQQPLPSGVGSLGSATAALLTRAVSALLAAVEHALRAHAAQAPDGRTAIRSMLAARKVRRLAVDGVTHQANGDLR
jgi:hypothetical protein